MSINEKTVIFIQTDFLGGESNCTEKCHVAEKSGRSHPVNNNPSQLDRIQMKYNTNAMQCNTKTNQLDRIQSSVHVRDTVVLIEKHPVSVKD